MAELFYYKVHEAYEKCERYISKDGRERSLLADELWAFKRPGEDIDANNREYVSWVNSLPCLLGCAESASLHDTLVVFEMKTPVSHKAVDVTLIGISPTHELRIAIFELKQWDDHDISGKVYKPNKVYVRSAHQSRKHPFLQLNLYEKNLRIHHLGIHMALAAGKEIKFEKVAYLHNCYNPRRLMTGDYNKWADFDGKIFGCTEEDNQSLINTLRNWFVSETNEDLLRILENYEAILGDEGLEGLRRAYHNEASYEMQRDQQGIVEFVNEKLEYQKDNENHRGIIVISGGPGTGKTIVGIRFILEYLNIFNNGQNDNKAIFCLPKSQTVKAVFDAACSVDEENENEYCCYLQEISYNQNLVVVDEAHRITKLSETLDSVFDDKEAKLLILLQDDHQILRPGEEGTLDAFRDYANRRGIDFWPSTQAEKTTLTLIDEKRCDETLLQGLNKLLFDDPSPIKGSIDCVKICDSLSDLENWKNEKAMNSRTKYIFPFCWSWPSRNPGHENDYDIKIGQFSRQWNPVDTDEQVLWLNDNTDDRVACIYTSQGLDMDNVAFVWCDDLKWNEAESRWDVNINRLKDPEFRAIFDKNDHLWHKAKWDFDSRSNVLVHGGYAISQQAMNLLVRNTYYVILSRPRHNLGIWFKDEATKRHVAEILGLTIQRNADVTDNTELIVGNSSNYTYHKPECRYAPRNPKKREEFVSIEKARNAGYSPCRTCNP